MLISSRHISNRSMYLTNLVLFSSQSHCVKKESWQRPIISLLLQGLRDRWENWRSWNIIWESGPKRTIGREGVWWTGGEYQERNKEKVWGMPARREFTLAFVKDRAGLLTSTLLPGAREIFFRLMFPGFISPRLKKMKIATLSPLQKQNKKERKKSKVKVKWITISSWTLVRHL